MGRSFVFGDPVLSEEDVPANQENNSIKNIKPSTFNALKSGGAMTKNGKKLFSSDSQNVSTCISSSAGTTSTSTNAFSTEKGTVQHIGSNVKGSTNGCRDLVVSSVISKNKHCNQGTRSLVSENEPESLIPHISRSTQNESIDNLGFGSFYNNKNKPHTTDPQHLLSVSSDKKDNELTTVLGQDRHVVQHNREASSQNSLLPSIPSETDDAAISSHRFLKRRSSAKQFTNIVIRRAQKTLNEKSPKERLSRSYPDNSHEYNDGYYSASSAYSTNGPLKSGTHQFTKEGKEDIDNKKSSNAQMLIQQPIKVKQQKCDITKSSATQQRLEDKNNQPEIPKKKVSSCTTNMPKQPLIDCNYKTIKRKTHKKVEQQDKTFTPIITTDVMRSTATQRVITSCKSNTMSQNTYNGGASDFVETLNTTNTGGGSLLGNNVFSQKYSISSRQYQNEKSKIIINKRKVDCPKRDFLEDSTILLQNDKMFCEPSSVGILYDLKFGGLFIKLHKKLSAKCHCQFDVWEAEVVAFTLNDNYIYSSEINNNAMVTYLQNHTAIAQNTLVPSKDVASIHLSIYKKHTRFALKTLNLDYCDKGKLRYKTHSILAEGKQLKKLSCELYENTRNSKNINNTAINNNNNDDRINEFLIENVNHRYFTSCSVETKMPIPQYLWTSSGTAFQNNENVLAVAMEMIHGRSLTHLLQQLRGPLKPSMARLILEIALKLVESQRILSEKLNTPLINWDTKPGNVLLELTKDSLGRPHCKRAVVVDLGDALPGPVYSFPTRHRPGESPGYIICTKGYCSPECALLVFLLASSTRCSMFRKMWYSESACLEKLQDTRKERVLNRWRKWVGEGYLKRNHFVVSSDNKTNIENNNDNTLYSEKKKKTEEKTVRGYWEIRFSEKSVVFSTGLVLAQLFGGSNILQLVNKDEVRALDVLCEWNCLEGPNYYSGLPNVKPADLLPKQGFFATEPWRTKLLVLLNNCLGFLPSDRWSFAELETYLRELVNFHAAAEARCPSSLQSQIYNTAFNYPVS